MKTTKPDITKMATTSSGWEASSADNNTDTASPESNEDQKSDDFVTEKNEDFDQFYQEVNLMMNRHK